MSFLHLSRLPILIFKRFSVSRDKKKRSTALRLSAVCLNQQASETWINVTTDKRLSHSRARRGVAPRSAIPGASRGDSNVIRECVEGVRKVTGEVASYLKWGSLLLCTMSQTCNVRALNVSKHVWTSRTGFSGICQFYPTSHARYLQ